MMGMMPRIAVPMRPYRGVGAGDTAVDGSVVLHRVVAAGSGNGRDQWICRILAVSSCTRV